MSGFPGSDFYGFAGIGAGSAVNGGFRYQYKPQVGGGILVDPAVVPPVASAQKRSLTDLERQQQFLLRSVKQRNHQTSPISPLSPIDFSAVSPDISTASSGSSSSSSTSSRPAFSVLQQRQQHMNGDQPNSSSLLFSGFPAIRPAPAPEALPDSDKKLKNQLQELERQLLLDENDEDDSVLTSTEWNETMQNLIKPLSPTCSSSSSSSTSSSSSRQLLSDTATAISEGNIDQATAILTRLNQVTNPRGDPEQRLTSYMVAALLSRINPPENPHPIAELCSSEHQIATQMLYEVSPCFKLGFVAANLAILESMQNHPKIHVLDFDIGQGYHYITLIHALAERHSHKPTIKITAVSNPTTLSDSHTLQIVGNRLTKLAEQVGLYLRFGVVCRRTSDLNRQTLGCELDEALAVNFAFRLFKMPDESVSTANPRDELLRLVKGLNPKVVTLVEQEMNANTAPFVPRFTEVCAYYRALFESLDATMARDKVKRVMVEECLARKATNSVAREGKERVERCEVFGKWRARMGMAGFKPKPLGSHIAAPLRNGLCSSRNGFFVKEEAGGLCFGWMGRVLTVASAWH